MNARKGLGRLRGRAEALATERRQLHRLRRRVERLEDEVQEARRLNRRVAELTDIVGEVLLPAAGRDDERLRQRLEEYRKGL